MIDKKKFAEVVRELQKQPSNDKLMSEYTSMILHLSEIIAKKYSLVPLNDVIQELACKVLENEIHKKADTSKNVFSYFWTIMCHEAFRLKGISEWATIDVLEDMEQVLSRHMGHSQAIDGDEILLREEAFDTIYAKSENYGRGRIPKDTRSLPLFWNDIYKRLLKYKYLSESSIKHYIPDAHRYKHIERVIEYYMNRCAVLNGHVVYKKQTRTETIYVLQEAK